MLLVSDNSLKVIPDLNTMLRVFMIQNNLNCEPGVDRLIFYFSKGGNNYSNGTPFVTIWRNTVTLKQFNVKLLHLEETVCKTMRGCHRIAGQIDLSTISSHRHKNP